jgi:hypothetical protein
LPFLNGINYVMAHPLLLPRRALCTRVFNVTSRSCDLAAEAATKGLLSLQPARVPEENAAAQADQSANRLVPPPKQKATEHSPSPLSTSQSATLLHLSCVTTHCWNFHQLLAGKMSELEQSLKKY